MRCACRTCLPLVVLRCLLVFLGGLLFLGCPVTCALAQTNFGTVTVGQSSSPITVTLTFPIGTTLGQVKVVTQGTAGLDFQQGAVTNSPCVGFPTSGQCTVNVIFTPKGIGQRVGAVQLYSSHQPITLLDTVFLVGNGSGGLLNFTSTTAAVGSGLKTPIGIAADAAGNVYIADQDAGQVVKVTANGGAQTTIATVPNPWGVAVDGAGNVYIAEDYGPVVEVPAAGGQPVTIASGNYVGVALDGAGNVYLGDDANARVVKVPSGGGTQTVIASGLTGIPSGIAVDVSGNVYIATYGSIIKVPAGGGAQTTVGTGIIAPTGVAVDGSGNVYIADQGGARIVEVSAGGGAQTTIAAGINTPFGVAVDGVGNLYLTDLTKTYVVELQQAQLPSTVSLGSVTVSGTPGTASLSFTNIGNASFGLSSFASSPYSEIDGCGSIAVNAICTLHLTFRPTSGSIPPGATVTGSLTLSGNALNLPYAVSLTGQAIQTPSQLVFSTPPPSFIEPGSPVGTIGVTVKDDYGNVVTSSATPVSLLITGPGYSQGFGPITSSAGGSTFSLTGLTLTTPGVYTYTATTSTGLTSAVATETVVPNAYSVPAQAVGSTGTATTVTLAFGSGATLGAIKVVTQGMSGLDFQQAATAGGSCTVNTTYAAGQSCTVNVLFSPTGVGQRLGAVLLYDTASTPNLLATAFLSGIGNGGLLNFTQTQTTVGSGLQNPDGVAVDVKGNVYIADFGNNRVVEVPVGCSGSACQIIIGSGLTGPTNVAVDGAGSVYIADTANNRVVKVVAGGGAQTTVGTGFHTPFGVAVDGGGNVYIANSNTVVEVAAGGTQTIVASGFTSPDGVAVDGSGNVYVADNYSNQVVVVPSGGSGQTTIGTGLQNPTGVAVDGAGNTYIVDSGNNRIVVVRANGVQTALGSGFNSPFGIAVDGTGNIYIADYGNNRVAEVQQTQLPLTVNLGNVTVGSTPGTSSLSFTNIGNTSLALSSVVSPGQYGESDVCNGSVAVNGSCTLNLTFTPTTGTASPGTTVAGTLTLTDNALTSPQVINLTANAIAVAPVITTQPLSVTINSGQAATLSVVASGTVPLSYQWYAGTSPNTGAPIAGATSATFTTPSLTASTSYWVRVSNAAGLANSSTAIITVVTPPTITTQPPSQTINSGQTATLSVAVTGTAPLTYQWYAGASPNTAVPVTGATSAAFTTFALTATASYWVRVTNAAGHADSSTAIISVVTPPAITTQPLSQTINSGQTATLSVVVTGTAPLSYQWYAGISPNLAAPVTGATASSFTTPALITSTSYWVRVSNAAGNANSSTDTISVNQPPVCTLSTAATATALTIMATATCTDPQNEPLTTTIDWGDQTPVLTGSTGTHTYVAAGAYTVMATAADTAGSTNTASQIVTLTAQTANPVFPGQASTTALTVPPVSAASAGIVVTFVCTSVSATINGVAMVNQSPSVYGISCTSPSFPLSSTAAPQVNVTIQTTASNAVVSLRQSASRSGGWYGLTLPLPGLLILGFGLSKQSRRRVRRWVTLGGLSLLMLSCVACGGYFQGPAATTTTQSNSSPTPAALYYVTVTDQPVTGNPTGFVQTSLIVPLPVAVAPK